MGINLSDVKCKCGHSAAEHRASCNGGGVFGVNVTTDCQSSRPLLAWNEARAPQSPAPLAYGLQDMPGEQCNPLHTSNPTGGEMIGTTAVDSIGGGSK
jgi:hypothetical protein